MRYQYPEDVLPPRKVVPEIVAATTGGGRGITAVEDVVSFDAGYWQIDLDEIPLASYKQKRAWRALSANLGGRLGVCDVPIYVGAIAPFPLDSSGEPILPWLARFSDLTEFSDDTAFSDADITATVSVGGALGAVELTIDISTTDQALEAGMDFSVDGGTPTIGARARLYRIVEILSTGTAAGVNRFQVLLSPPLREAVATGAAVNFADPRCTCRLIDDGQMRSGADDYAGRTLASISFVEAVN